MLEDLGRANPLLTYLVGILLGGSVARAYIADEGEALALNAFFMLTVLALVVLSEVSYRTGTDDS